MRIEYSLIDHIARTVLIEVEMTDTSVVYARIAVALGISSDGLRRSDICSEAKVVSLNEAAELLEDFRRIKDRQARRRCLSYVKNAAGRLERR